MAIAQEHVGRTYPPTEPYEVTAVKVAEFAAALGDPDPRYAGPDAVAPPTFAAVLAATAWQALFEDPELDLALRRVVHGDQRFDFHRLLRVGDRVTATLTIDKVRVRGAADIIGASIAIRTLDDEPVATAVATFFHSREAAA
ncbi:MaoC family dehydratase N-terminal domain-containing protein [Microlunatus capsulatus]|uniref:Acyl dehydratase n=1 Tax=Microlunatus capsulatus TaxID=99117 RepID=A0ABS4Z772_9ACTN|nr:MaoC family dehydratase N-terminal domain-containing protein [Microlunatus capsulatus]MBP2416625.1 acyl dehydratase [Microlunatus capsulatus]